MFPTAMATRACTSIRPTESCFSPGANRAPIPGNSTSCTTSCTDKEGWVYVADRENHRVQVFDGNGKYETQWNNMHRPCALYMDTTKKDPICYVGELGPGMWVNKEARISAIGSISMTRRANGWRVWEISSPAKSPANLSRRMASPSDSRGDIYVGEVSWTIMGQHLQPPRELRSLQKLKKLN